jgi:RNA polymerase sigma factor (sigma-70 family)
VYERAKAESAHTSKALTRIAKNEYAKRLYDACLPSRDAGQRAQLERAYQELGRALYRSAYRWLQDDPLEAEAAAQRAIARVYTGMLNDECRNPGAFMAFALGKLRGEITRGYREAKKGPHRILSFSEMSSGDEDTEEALDRKLVDPEAVVSPEQEAERALLAEALWDELSHKFRIHPRAESQLRAVILKHAWEYSNKEIAQILGVDSSKKVSDLIARGKKKLADNVGLDDLYTSFSSTVAWGKVA